MPSASHRHLQILRKPVSTAGLAGSIAFGAVCVMGASAEAATPYGVWVDHTGRGAVEVKKCGATLCGVVVWARKRAEARRGCGRKLFGGLKQVGLNSWDNGWIIEPDTGSKYDVAIKPLGRNRLQVTGYAGTKLFSRSMIFKRAPSNLKRCDDHQKATEVIAKAKTQPPRRPLGVGAPNVPLIPETALEPRNDRAAPRRLARRAPVMAEPGRQAPPRRASLPAAEESAPRIVFYTPPKSAPLPGRHPGGSTMARLALATAGVTMPGAFSAEDGAAGDNAAEVNAIVGGADLIVPPKPRLVERRSERTFTLPAFAEQSRVTTAANLPASGRSGACEVRAPFVVSSIPCAR